MQEAIWPCIARQPYFIKALQLIVILELVIAVNQNFSHVVVNKLSFSFRYSCKMKLHLILDLVAVEREKLLALVYRKKKF